MFLALREIRHQPTRFALIVAVITLVAYLTFFLAALAGGLAHAYRAAVDQWGAASVVLTEESNSNIAASRLSDDQVEAADEILGDGATALVSVPVVIEKPELRSDAYAFGIDLESPLTPEVVSGQGIARPSREVLADDSLEKDGWKLGDTLRLAGSDHDWQIVGFTNDQTFQTVSVVFVDRQALVNNGPQSLAASVNAVVSASELTDPLVQSLEDENLQGLTTTQFINTLPGYQAQVLTFSLMIGSLIVIASFVLGIFIYVLTLQKRPVLGILKARGVPTKHLIWSGAAQTTLLAAFGVLLGLGLTLATSLVLPDAIPFRVDPILDAAITAAFVLCSVVGGLISVRVVSRIDPVEAIS